ncbi:acyltransferase family protein [Tolypothrix sp. VBCCA 56010]|uniref:acyltransferase family protein n=1 Tax=Tolypothrix sp. VBCCA 56010 TaxID=3137731 RepID=UPI003D7D52F2
MSIEASPVRILWIDTAKAYGMFLVFYGHFLEKLSDLGKVSAFLQFKFIYSFHMPLFFILAGYLSKKTNLNYKEFFRYHFTSRIIPVIFFNLLAMAISIPQDIFLGSLHLNSYLFGLINLVKGCPVYNFVTWFLVCLFTVENIHFFLSQYLNKSKQLIIFTVILFLIGWLISLKIEFVTSVTGIGKNFWFVHESLVAYLFYQSGSILKSWELFDEKRTFQFFILLFTGLIVLFTFNLNTDPFTVNKSAVIMAMSSHGNLVLFPLTALAGSLFVISLAKLTPDYQIILFIGQNTLILLGLNGLFFNFVNQWILSLINNLLTDSHLVVFEACSLLTLISLVLCIPCVFIFNKFIPQLVGKPKVSGPLLKNLL